MLFDGILIASDWDGTICTGGVVSQKTATAVRYFQEHGGLFTIASGRYPEHLDTFSEIITPNTYQIALNGAVISDRKSGKILFSGHCGDDIYDVLRDIVMLGTKYDSVWLYPIGDTHATRYSAEYFIDNFDKMRHIKTYKSILTASQNEGCEEEEERIRQCINLRGYYALRSFETSLEIISKDLSKGSAVERLKTVVHARVSVTVGDYENDIPMLCDADLSYAVQNAIPSVKLSADVVTEHTAADGALSEVISDIERRLLSGEI